MSNEKPMNHDSRNSRKEQNGSALVRDNLSLLLNVRRPVSNGSFGERCVERHGSRSWRGGVRDAAMMTCGEQKQELRIAHGASPQSLKQNYATLSRPTISSDSAPAASRGGRYMECETINDRF
jgi:hypothetical protein